MGWSLLWAVQLITDDQLEDDTQVRTLEEVLRLNNNNNNNLWLFTTLLPPGLADKMGEQNNKSWTLTCHFAKLGGHKLLWIKIWELKTKLFLWSLLAFYVWGPVSDFTWGTLRVWTNRYKDKIEQKVSGPRIVFYSEVCFWRVSDINSL